MSAIAYTCTCTYFVFYNEEKLILFILQLSGAAPLPKAVSDFYAGFDIALLQVYGMSETTGISTINTPGKEIKCKPVWPTVYLYCMCLH